MGLDSVELAIAIEMEFTISITDFHASGITTVGALVDHVHSAVNGLDPSAAREEWQRIDQEFEAATGRSIRNLPRSTRVVDLLAPGREAIQWAKINALPRPVLPWPLQCAVGVAAILAFLIPPVVFTPSLGSFAVGSALALATSIALLCAFARWRSIPDPELTLASLRWWREPRPGEGTSRRAIAQRVREVIAAQLGVDPALVTDDARFVEDLGLS